MLPEALRLDDHPRVAAALRWLKTNFTADKHPGQYAADRRPTQDAVYFYYAEALVRQKQEAEALPLYERLVNEFEKSEFLVEAQRRIEELKQAQSKSGQ